jgi:hypothetical protein
MHILKISQADLLTDIFKAEAGTQCYLLHWAQKYSNSLHTSSQSTLHVELEDLMHGWEQMCTPETEVKSLRAPQQVNLVQLKLKLKIRCAPFDDSDRLSLSTTTPEGLKPVFDLTLLEVYARQTRLCRWRTRPHTCDVNSGGVWSHLLDQSAWE